MKAGGAIAGGIAALLMGGVVLGVALDDSSENDGASVACAPGTSAAVQASLEGLPQKVGAFEGEQLVNAALIINAGKALGVSARGQQIAVMTAIGESTLQVLDRGDGPGPDSRGLFQQRDNGAWGTYADRMDPTTSATNFYKVLVTVAGWETLEPTIAAHKVQRNADPYHYAKSWDAAGELLVTLSGFDPGAAGAGCDTGEFGGMVSAAGWAHPIPGLRTYQDNYNQFRTTYTHKGEDLSAPLGTPLYAAATGQITHVSCEKLRGRSPCNIILDAGLTTDGKRVEIVYVHMYPDQLLVSVGQQVAAGEKIAETGNNGNSQGAHLHLEVWLDRLEVDPTAWFAEHGVDITKKADSPLPAAGAGTTVLAWAQTQIGMPYVLGDEGPNSYDCSGLTLRAWEKAGKTLPRVSADQWGATTRITREQLQPGDLVFWSNTGTPAGIYHVAIYAGNGQVVHAPRSGKTVEQVALFSTNLLGYGRVA